MYDDLRLEYLYYKLGYDKQKRDRNEEVIT